MKERPILFSTSMVQAILEGRKTMTRRIVKPQPLEDEFQDGLYCPAMTDRNGELYPGNEVYGISTADWGIKCSHGKPGDKLWVRETYMPCALTEVPIYLYKADGDLNNALIALMEDQSWKPSIFMPRRASRITLRIINIHVERLQDISGKDAENEGVYIHPVYPSPRMEFANLWESINGKGSWDINPYVWVIEFEKIKP